PIHVGSSVESGFEPGALRPQSRDLTTRPTRPRKTPATVSAPNFQATIVGWMTFDPDGVYDP
ncbi:hypothetical protein AVEN_167289-1, partial [Araneus ventricosus]